MSIFRLDIKLGFSNANSLLWSTWQVKRKEKETAWAAGSKKKAEPESEEGEAKEQEGNKTQTAEER